MSTTPQRRSAKRLPPAERRDQVLDAAIGLIAESGYGGLTMQSVARAAQVTRPVVYDFFANREELLDAIVAREEEHALRDVLASIPELPAEGPADPEAFFAELIENFLRAVQANPNTWRVIYLPVEGTPAAARERMEEARRTFRDQLEQVLAWSIALRGGPHGLDLTLLAYLCQAFSEVAARLVLTEPDEFSPERVARFVQRLLSALERDEPAV